MYFGGGIKLETVEMAVDDPLNVGPDGWECEDKAIFNILWRGRGLRAEVHELTSTRSKIMSLRMEMVPPMQRKGNMTGESLQEVR